jgi:sugar (pentulose or hexulose) kinase
LGRYAAVDLGASSGRVMVGTVGPGTVGLSEAHRFPNLPVRVSGTLFWDVLGLYRGVLEGLRAAGGGLTSVGIDSWAVDYGLIGDAGALRGNPVHYRDGRTTGVAARVFEKVPAEKLYATTGLQHLPFNTVYQLVAESDLAHAAKLLLIPDLIAYWLTGAAGAEATNASTTGLFDVGTGDWAWALIGELGLPARLFPPVRRPGELIGETLPEAGIGKVPVVAVGSHDTASAVVGVPARDARFAYISCGTWSLVGLELDAPILSEASRQANFTNEGGVDGSIRYLRNVMGLWLLQESLRTWGLDGSALPELLGDAASEPAFAAVVDPDDETFLPPGDMPARIAEFCRRTGQAPPGSRAAVVRCVLDSLALAYRRTLRRAQELSGHEVDVVHIVGGGALNTLLCQLTADACGLPVEAGPVEAAAFGNVLVQARAAGEAGEDLTALRGLLRASQHVVRYEPRPGQAVWDAAERRLPGLATSGRP